jgi:hypothetical protein
MKLRDAPLRMTTPDGRDMVGHPLNQRQGAGCGAVCFVRVQRGERGAVGLRPLPYRRHRLVEGNVAAELLQQSVDRAAAAFGFGVRHLGDGGEGAELGVELDLFDRGGGVRDDRSEAREGEAGDLQAVEQQAGAAGIQLIAGDALEDLDDGLLKAAAVSELGGQVEDGLLRAAAFLVGLAGLQFAAADGPAAGVVVVTKTFLAESWAAAAMAVGEDVAALETGFGVRLDAGVRRRHVGSSPHRGFLGKVGRTLGLGPDFAIFSGSRPAAKCGLRGGQA